MGDLKLYAKNEEDLESRFSDGTDFQGKYWHGSWHR